MQIFSVFCMKKWELCLKHFLPFIKLWWLSKGKAFVSLCEFLDEGWRQVSLCSSLRIPLCSRKFSLFYIYSIQITLLSLRFLVLYPHFMWSPLLGFFGIVTIQSLAFQPLGMWQDMVYMLKNGHRRPVNPAV